MIFGDRKISWIEGTPLGISIYSVEQTQTLMHENILEIIFCLKGSVNFSYGYDNVHLEEGDFISVDKDAYYLYDGKENICISFFFDLRQYKEKYPHILMNLFLCNGNRENQAKRSDYRQVKGKMITLLNYLSSEDIGKRQYIKKLTDDIIELFINRFDLVFYEYDDLDSITPEMLDKYHAMNAYICENLTRKITVKDLADEFNFSEGYISEFLRKISIGFRNMVSYRRVILSEYFLLNTDKIIIQISEECGFSDVQYYYSAFKKWLKCTPKQFRRRYKSRYSKGAKIRYYTIEEIKEDLEDTLVKHYIQMFS